MKKKEEKTATPLLTVSEVDGTKAVHPAAVAGSRWLKAALGEDPEALKHQEHCLASENFLQTQLYPLVDREVKFNIALLVNLLVEYKKNTQHAGWDFEISNVIGTILNRFELYSAGNPNVAWSEDFEMLDKDVTLLEILSEMDLQTVDRQVKQRMGGQ